jgi:hypothetical protein
MSNRPKRRRKAVVTDLESDDAAEEAPVSKVRVRKGQKDARPSTVRVLADASRVQAPVEVQKKARKVSKTPAAEDSGAAEAIAQTLLDLSKDDKDT